MTMLKTLLPVLILFSYFNNQVQATGLKISNEILFVEGPRDNRQMYAILYVEWQNAWKNDRNNDAVWLFCKFLSGDDGYRHITLKPSGHAVLQSIQPPGVKINLEVSGDGTGLFISPAEAFRGTVALKIKLAIDAAPLADFNTDRAAFKAFGLEMVHVPTGSFYVGESDSTAAFQYAAFYQPNEQGGHAGPVYIQSEQALEFGKDFSYRVQRGIYQGDVQGPVPDAFPKGFHGFYIMKYEITQGNYADFLNSLSREQSQLRNNFGGKGYYNYRGTIALNGEKYSAASPDRPCNFLSWDDAMAFADWCALRPMTELEFEKACRADRKPTDREFPWGNADKLQVERRVNPAGDLVHLQGKSESELFPDNLAEFAASPYGVLDLAGSLWERCITVGDSTGRAFKGSHGDGRLSYFGFATNPDWPSGVQENGGFGFRGGGFYHHDRGYHEFNPFSPVSYRPYGAWSGGNRTEAYGSRLVRTR